MTHDSNSAKFNLRADATAADTRGYMGSRYVLHWPVLGARILKKSLKHIEKLSKSMRINENY